MAYFDWGLGFYPCFFCIFLHSLYNIKASLLFSWAKQSKIRSAVWYMQLGGEERKKLSKFKKSESSSKGLSWYIIFSQFGFA